MTEAWRSDGSGVDTLPWHVLPLDTSSPATTGQEGGYLVKGVFHQESGYHVMLLGSFASVIWEERIDANQIMQRLKVLQLFWNYHKKNVGFLYDDPLPVYYILVTTFYPLLL